MEILGCILFVVILCFLPHILNAGGKTVGAAAKTAVGKGSFKDNMGLAFKGMAPLEAKMESKEEDGETPALQELLVKGLFPVHSNTRVGFVTSVLDNTGDELKSVISFIDDFQEPDNASFQCTRELPVVTPDTGFVSWVNVGVVFPDILVPPYSGTRTYMVILRLVDLDNMPQINYGFLKLKESGLLWVESFSFQHTFKERGYKEATENREKSQQLTIRIAMAVAMSDGSLDVTEGNAMKSWIEKTISIYEPSERNRLKDRYNSVLKGAYTDARSGHLDISTPYLSSLTSELNKIAEKKEKYDAIELCYQVMSADGEAAQEEMKILSKITKDLDLDFDEIKKIKDKAFITLTTSPSKNASMEDLLEIDPSWDNATVRKYIRTEFQKWNNRITALPDSEERKIAQGMLDMLADAKKKYDESIVKSTSPPSKAVSLEDRLGIDPSWDNATVQKYIRVEVLKWEKRAITLHHGVELDTAQMMLHFLYEANDKYG